MLKHFAGHCDNGDWIPFYKHNEFKKPDEYDEKTKEENYSDFYNFNFDSFGKWTDAK